MPDTTVSIDRMERELERLSRTQKFINILADRYAERLERFQNDPEFRAIILRRFIDGEAAFGLLDVNDGRDWSEHSDEEGVDDINYLINDFLKDEARGL